ncbi:MAG: HD domain-containing protein [Campylobacterales bacterium]|nr:HD domain-containing protein [Campylobacterales bacterium]
MLEEKIEDLIEQNAPDFAISKLFKAEIAAYRDSLQQIFEVNQGKDFLVKHTKTLDSLIAAMYKTVLRRTFGNYLPMRGSIPIALIALGSYGREQLCVHSDIDLLIVYEPCEGYNTQKIIEKFLYMVWDTGLKLGHRVHETSDLPKAAGEDITIRTALMESRLIIGSPFTWSATQRQLGIIRHTNPKGFILEKIEEAHQRRRKYPQSMQPNIKESVGGLRDSQLLYWIANTIYGVGNLKELSGTLFSDEQYRDYRVALELLFRVRSALHLMSKKQQDQLTLDQMHEAARMLGFEDERKLVSKLLEAQWRINNFTQIYVKKMIRPLLVGEYPFSALRAGRIAPHIYRIDTRLFATATAPVFKIEALLELLLRLEDRVWQFDPSFLALFTYAAIRHPLKKATYTLLRALFERRYMYCFLELFYHAGILQHLIGAFRKVAHLPQFDGYHHYPVDLHSIKCIAALEHIGDPYILALYNTLSPKEQTLLKVIVLLHDTGKGRKQDHSEVGAKLIVPFARQLGFNETDQQLCALLVRYHIRMSGVAFKENIYNEETLYRFMSSIQSAQNLKLLYILTYADINGVGSGIYTSFNARLLRELYEKALEVSQNAERITDASKRLRIEKRLANADAFTELPKALQKKILSVESNLFFLKSSQNELLAICQKAQNVERFYFEISVEKTFIIKIWRKIPLNLGFLLGSLSYLDVVAMDIFTLFDGVKYFKLEFALLPAEETLGEIERIIEDSFDMSRSIALKQPIIKRSEISFDCEHSKTFAEMIVNTSNQKGLLAYIMNCFDALHVNVATAKIYSTKTRANDHFLIEKESGMCDNAEKVIDLLIKGMK